eukprot:7367499-Pyramimonas_sp.AAC.1
MQSNGLFAALAPPACQSDALADEADVKALDEWAPAVKKEPVVEEPKDPKAKGGKPDPKAKGGKPDPKAKGKK